MGSPRLLTCSFLAAAAGAVSVVGGQTSEWVYRGQNDRLLYLMDSGGDRIGDFSRAGYKFGQVPLPDAAAVVTPDRVVTLTPQAGDNASAIQNAINRVSALAPNANGFRGVVQLEAGDYDLGNTLSIRSSGVILRGRGDSFNPSSDTILRATHTRKISVLTIGNESAGLTKIAGTEHSMVDKTVPAGATSFRVDSTANWSVGDAVVVHRPSTQEWISAIGMDRIPEPHPDVVQWEPGTKDQNYERTITRIEGDRVFLDAPVFNSFEQRYGGGKVYRYDANRINNVGVEGIRAISEFEAGNDRDENHADTFIEIRAAEDVWARDVSGRHMSYATVFATGASKNVTVQGAQSIEPVSEITGSRRYAYVIDGQYTLMRDLYSADGRHDFVNNSAGQNRGPNVFLNGRAVRPNSDAGPHQRWSTGTLYDNINSDGETNVRNREWAGTGHGWAGANMVVWNNKAREFSVQNPPTAQNWLIGSEGRITEDRTYGTQPSGYYDSHGTRVTLGDRANNPMDSLYVAQLNERLSNPTARMREYVVGDYDGFTVDASPGVDDAYIDPAWQSAVRSAFDDGGTTAFKTLDADGNNAHRAFTFVFDLAPDERVMAATLTLALRAAGSGSGGVDDQLWIDGVQNRILLADLGVDGDFGTTDVYTIEFLPDDLAAGLSFLNDGVLNLNVTDDTLVNWANLQIVVDDIVAVPEPASAALLVPATLLLARRRRGRA